MKRLFIIGNGRNLDPASVTWYINSYDSDNNPEFRDKIEAYGFKVKVEDGW